MTLPTFTSIRRPRRAQNASVPAQDDSVALSESRVKAATRTRLIFALLTSFFFLIALAFLILVEVGNTHPSHPVLGSIYFLKLDLSHITPVSVPNAVLINSIARTLGLHDFYQVGLWNFCEGYYGQGITDCSKPRTLYWFNPVQIILDELLAGATIALPANIVSALTLVRVVSHWMFGLFLTGACTAFVSVFLTPLSIYSRLLTLPIAVLAFVSALATTVATVIATVMFVIFKNVLANAAAEINIGAALGTKMFVFMWIASSFIEEMSGRVES
ncbi:Actin cortical patch SUR7/pH-response regulator PalI [Lasallia pustulata]|uniref:Actin cortical patch SUR7/pH-response regulator PalI n=1 Tax=Lasallia pustulata TaxID=136370 RepID=A0A1W5DDF5_9LECA|nr:Actin cortical patch SUR7/pH-response regulator PalI [Lasallia pustulata]